jgi:hypothetical protein
MYGLILHIEAMLELTKSGEKNGPKLKLPCKRTLATPDAFKQENLLKKPFLRA